MIAMEQKGLLQMRGICMTFPGVKALQNVDFSLKKGEIRALMGENGAGKSTLIKCLTGVNQFEAGQIYLEGFSGCWWYCWYFCCCVIPGLGAALVKSHGRLISSWSNIITALLLCFFIVLQAVFMKRKGSR